MKSQYRNTILGDIVDNISGKTAHEEEMARIATLNALASKPASSNTLLILIPVIGVVIGVIAIVILKRKK
jgi:hypothetical protein